jgi:hypothetical protein
MGSIPPSVLVGALGAVLVGTMYFVWVRAKKR